MLLDHDGGYRDDSGYEQVKGYFKGRRDRTGGTLDFSLSLSDLDQETAGFITGPQAYKDLDTRFTNPNPEAFREAGSRRASLTWSPDSGAVVDAAMARLCAQFRHGIPAALSAGQAARGERPDQRWRAVHRAPRHWDGGEWGLGFDTELARGWLEETQENPAVGSPFIVATRPVGKHYDYRVYSGLIAAHSNIRWPVTDRLELQGGLRLEYLRYDYDNKMVSGNTQDDGVTECGFGGCQYARPEDRTDNFTNLAPNLGLVFRINDTHSLFASATRGFRAPQATELYRLQRGQLIADIRSEKLNSVEAGWRHRGPALSVELAAFLMRKKNFIFRDATDSNVSDGKTRHVGIELSADWSITEHWYAGFTGSHSKQEYRFTRSADLGEEIAYGNDIDTAPRTLASARLGFSYLRGTAEVEWAYTDSYFMDAANATRYEGHQLINMRVLFDVSDTLTAGVRLNNVTDEVYADRADLLAVSTPPVERYFPGHPREIYASLTWRR